MQSAANLNPVEWAVVGGRAAARGDGGFDVVATRAGLLTGFVALSAWLAVRALEVSALALSAVFLDPLPLGEAGVATQLCLARRLVSSGVLGAIGGTSVGLPSSSRATIVR